MEDQILVEVIKYCISADKKAQQLYTKFAKLSANDDLENFWLRMAADEKSHIRYWDKLLEMAQQDSIPQIFEHLLETKKELELILHQIDGLARKNDDPPSIDDMFMMAFRLEFYMLHPVVMGLLHFLSSLPSHESPMDDYYDHLKSFTNAFNKFGSSMPEVEFMCETIIRLWKDNRELSIQSYTDELTGILNRRGLFNTIRPLAYLAQRGKLKVGVMIVDIDNFKSVNDTHGHQIGDKVLAWVSQVLDSAVRRSDVIGRYGGEEFILYFSDSTPEQLREVAEKLRDRIESESKKQIPLTISIGISSGQIVHDVEQELELLIKIADDKLYEAKAAGKNMVCMS